jgi:hypothetical protein
MNFKLNVKIIQTLYKKGFKIRQSFRFVNLLFETIKKEDVLVDMLFLKTVEDDLKRLKMDIIELVSLFKKMTNFLKRFT